MDGYVMHRTARWAVTIAACGAVLAGCGGGGDWPAAAGSGGASATPGPAAPTTSAPVSDAGGAGSAGGAGNGGTHTGTGGAEAGGDERCHTSELAGSVAADPGGGAAGSSYATLTLRNQGGRTCYVRGFPGVSYVGGDDGHQIGPAAAMQGGHGDPVRLAPGGTAGATLRVVNVRNFDEAACRPTAVRGLRVYPPGETDSLFVPMEGTGCAATPPGDQLVIQAFTTR
ncbi:DUF4232 domain-containing protein [Pseudonocardia sp. McavD-2-B]|uniref:DUF4232 domain-containing protein n=1 Tax=Pseudonocardia sp. McavD-2-B TaxID=2954499 RepID=UPI00273A604D|nr:DUF4232 domain-containing protein [Pseudonocardia sp. McavD-2-B]